MIDEPDSRPVALEDLTPAWRDVAELSEIVTDRLRRGRPRTALAMAREAERRGVALPWALADRVAAACMHLGDPAAARQLWEGSEPPSSPALRRARIAGTYLAAIDFEAADKEYRRALALDRRLGEAWFGLALSLAQQGRAAEMLAACHEGLTCVLTEPERTTLLGMFTLVPPKEPKKIGVQGGPHYFSP